MVETARTISIKKSRRLRTRRITIYRDVLDSGQHVSLQYLSTAIRLTLSGDLLRFLGLQTSAKSVCDELGEVGEMVTAIAICSLP